MSEKLRIPLSRFMGILVLAFFGTSTSVWEARGHLMGPVLFFVGCTAAAAGAMGRLWCSFYVAGHKHTELATKGPYSMMRHPLYFFSLVGAIGVGFSYETFTLPLLIIVAFAIYYPSVMRQEEADMRRIHGEAFLDYSRRTPRFFPRVSLLREAEHCTADPIVFRSHILSAIWFVWIIGILRLVEALHTAGIIRTLFRIY